MQKMGLVSPDQLSKLLPPMPLVAVSRGDALLIAGLASQEGSTEKSRGQQARTLIHRRKYPFPVVELPGFRQRVVLVEDIRKCLIAAAQSTPTTTDTEQQTPARRRGRPRKQPPPTAA